MRFAVGYQMPDEEGSFATLVGRYREHIAEVYFPWMAMPSGRSPMTDQRGRIDWRAQEYLERDLAEIRQMGVRLDLLLNANCYGHWAVSQYLRHTVESIVEHLVDSLGLDLVTTTSPFIAQAIRDAFPKVEVRASVNMRIGTIKGMEYLADLFDSFYVQREYNRDLGVVQRLKAWADQHGKQLYLLANSGCLSFCSGQTFHDNLVAHETDVSETVNVEEWAGTTCRRYLSQRERWVSLLQGSWIRPEDIERYEGLVSVMKLATRMHANPMLVVHAYASGRFTGNLLDLLEPGFGPLLAPYVIDNARFPADWFSRTTACDKRCDRCGYCAAVLEQALVGPHSVEEEQKLWTSG